MNVQFQLQPISDNINITEMYLQELELIILNCMGSQKFKWNDFKDIKRKSSISDCHQKIKTLIENSQEVRETIRQLNREYLKLQLAIKNLAEFSSDIENKAREIETKLISEDFIQNDVQASFFEHSGRLFINENITHETIAQTNELIPLNLDLNELDQGDFLIPTLGQANTRFEYRII